MDSKKSNKKLMIIIAIVVVVIIAIVGVVVFINGNKKAEEEQKQATEELTGEEQFAVDYLLKFSNGNIFNNRYKIKVHKVWYYGWNTYIAYNITYQNKDGIEIEETVGNTIGLDVDIYIRATDKKTIVYNAEEVKNAIEEAYKKYPIVNTYGIRSNYWTTDNLQAVKNGKQLDAEKIQKAFEKAL